MPNPQVNGSKKKVGRPFPWVCPKCHEKEVRLTMMPYHVERLYDGRLVAVDIPQLEVPKCKKCGELVFNYAADEQILDALKAQDISLNKSMANTSLPS